MTSDEQQIRQLVATWIEATKAGDTDAVLSLMTDDVVFLVTGQPPMMGKAAFATAMQSQAAGPRPQFDGKSEIQEVQVLGDWAYMWTKLTVVVTPPGGQTMTRSGHTLSILKKQNGKWLLERDANMLSSQSN
jgi:uncharacterized protein (TIGR02246 family)